MVKDLSNFDTRLCSVGKPWVSGIHVDVSLTRTTYLNIVSVQVHPFIATVFFNGSGLFQWVNAPCHTAKTVQEWFEERDRKFKVLASSFPRSLSERASVGCAEQS